MNNEQSIEVITPSAIESVQRAEVDVQIATAHRYPRNIGRVKQDMMSYATLDQETAEGCFYSLPRGGRTIQGPSVRLAEIAASCYGNLRAGSRVISTETKGENPHVIIQAVAHDLEKNVAVTMEKRRRIVGKKSKGGTIDEDDINLATNACAAIAFRDAVFKVVPLALVKPVMEQAKKVAIGDAKTLADRRAKAMDTFAKMGVAKDRVLAAVEKQSVEEIGLAELETLLGLHTAIKEGAASVDDSFPPPKPKTLAELKREPSIRQAAEAEASDQISPEPAPEQSSAGKEEKQEAPAPGPAIGLTARQKNLAELLGRIFNEVPGSGWEHVTAFLDVKFPGRKLADVSDLCDVPDDVAGEVCNKSVSLRKFVSDLLSAQKGGAK